tara:strand:+ start:479 stop:688 length:210 start_codon:yes stop_codon:yes gene_type:complete
MTNKNLQCACKKIKFVNPGWNSPGQVNVRKGLFVLPYEEMIEPGTTKLKRYREIRHDVNECKATTGDEE